MCQNWQINNNRFSGISISSVSSIFLTFLTFSKIRHFNFGRLWKILVFVLLFSGISGICFSETDNLSETNAKTDNLSETNAETDSLSETNAFSETDNFSDTSLSEENVVVIDAVVVTADKTEMLIQTGDVDMENTPVSVSVIHRKDFEGKTENLAEVIEKEAGVQVRQSGGLGSFSTVSLRGSSSDQVMVFLDGILLNDASGGGVDLSSIALSDVESIEIYRGVTPVNFGKASIGGVVNIRTLRAEKGSNATLSAGYGAFNTRKLSGLINHKPGKWDYLFSADYIGADNDFEFLNDNGTKWNSLDDRWEERNNGQAEQYNLLGKAGYDVTNTLRVDFMNQYFNKKQGLPSWNNSPLTQSSLNTARDIATLRLTANDLTSLHLNSRTQFSYTWKEEEYDDRKGHIGLGDQHNTYTTSRLGVDFFGEWLTDYHTVLLSAALMTETYETRDYLKQRNPGDNKRNVVALGVQDTVFFMEDQLIITPGVRQTWVRDELKRDADILENSLEEKERSNDYLSSWVGVKYSPLHWLTLRSNLAKYVREPSFFELFGDRGFIIGNPDLREEKGVNFDFGAELNGQMSYPQLQRIMFNVACFRNDVDDLISRVYDARGIGKSVNISESLIQGVEFGATVEFLNYFRAVFNATWQNPENQSAIGAFNGKNLPGRFEASYLGRLEARHNGFTIYTEHIQEEGMYYDTANLLKADDKQLFNAGISWAGQLLMISLTGKNLKDEIHEDFNGYPSPGRSFYLSFKYNF